MFNPTYTGKFLLDLPTGVCYTFLNAVECGSSAVIYLGVKVGNKRWKMSWQVSFLWRMRHWKNSSGKRKRSFQRNDNPLAIFYWYWQWFNLITSHRELIRNKYMEEPKPLGGNEGSWFSHIRHKACILMAGITLKSHPSSPSFFIHTESLKERITEISKATVLNVHCIL